MFFLLFIRDQYESEPQVSMLYCNSICWITRLRCSCAIKLLHVLCCCHSVLQLGRSLFFSFLLFFLRYWCFITSVAVRWLAISYFAFFSAFVYYVTSFIPPSIFFLRLHFLFYPFYKSFGSYFFSFYLLTYSFLLFLRRCFLYFIIHFILLYFLYLHKFTNNSLGKECTSHVRCFSFYSFFLPYVFFYFSFCYLLSLI